MVSTMGRICLQVCLWSQSLEALDLGVSSFPAASIFTVWMQSSPHCILAGLSSVRAFLRLSLQGQKSYWIRDTPMASV